MLIMIILQLHPFINKQRGGFYERQRIKIYTQERTYIAYCWAKQLWQLNPEKVSGGFECSARNYTQRYAAAWYTGQFKLRQTA